MSKRIPTGITRNYLESIALPNHGGRYTPISHKSIIDKVHEELAARGFNVEEELYRASVGGNVANGMYILDQGSDPDMKMMFVWGNSYDKSMRFKCGVGVYIPKTGNYIFAGNISTYARKHTGKADEEAIQMIQAHLNMANAHYTELVNARNFLMEHTGTLKTYAELVGRLFIEKCSLNKEQASTVRDRLINEVTLLDNTTWDNAWNFYNSVATALRMSHPKAWFENQSDTHKLILESFNVPSVSVPVTILNTPVVEEVAEEVVQDPNQLDLLAVIAEVEAKTEEEEPFNEYIPMTIDDLPQTDQEQIYADDILQEKTINGKVDPDEDFFNFGDADLPTFELPDL